MRTLRRLRFPDGVRWNRKSLVTATATSWRPLASGRMIPVLELPKQGTSLEEVERELVGLALKQTGGNQTHAAKLLDVSRERASLQNEEVWL